MNDETDRQRERERERGGQRARASPHVRTGPHGRALRRTYVLAHTGVRCGEAHTEHPRPRNPHGTPFVGGTCLCSRGRGVQVPGRVGGPALLRPGTAARHQRRGPPRATRLRQRHQLVGLCSTSSSNYNRLHDVDPAVTLVSSASPRLHAGPARGHPTPTRGTPRAAPPRRAPPESAAKRGERSLVGRRSSHCCGRVLVVAIGVPFIPLL